MKRIIAISSIVTVALMIYFLNRRKNIESETPENFPKISLADRKPKQESKVLEKNHPPHPDPIVAVDQSAETADQDLPVEILDEDQISQNTIFNEEKYTADDIKEKFESSLMKLESVSSVAQIEELECTQKRCRMILSESLPDNAQADLYSYYLDHSQFGKYIHSDRSKDDPNKIVYTFSDDFTLGAAE